jgi:hypothetical protein
LFFTDAWGPLVEEREQVDRSRLLKVSSPWDDFFSFSDHKEVTTDLVRELGNVRQEVFQEHQRLRRWGNISNEKNLATLAMKKRLMFLFVRDLTSGVSGEVLWGKSQRDSQMSGAGVRSVSGMASRVSWKLKWMAGLFVFLLDGGMLFYVYLFAMHQTRSRQQAWFLSFVIWLGFEIFLSSTALVLVLHLLVPLYVWSDVAELKKKVLSDLLKFRDKYFKRKVSGIDDVETGLRTGGGDGERGGKRDAGLVEDPEVEFNAAKYLFTSQRVATLFPELPESEFVLQFSTPWPKKRFGKEEGKVAEEYEDDVLLTAASRILLYFLTSLLHYSSLVQDILIQTVSNGGLGYLCVLLVQLWNINPWLVVLTALVLLVCLYLVGRVSLRSLAKIMEKAATEDIEIPPPSCPPEAEETSLSPVAPQQHPTPVGGGGSVSSEGSHSHYEDDILWDSSSDVSSSCVDYSISAEGDSEESMNRNGSEVELQSASLV